MKIKMKETRMVAYQGLKMAQFKKGGTYEVSSYCGGFLLAYGYAEVTDD